MKRLIMKIVFVTLSFFMLNAVYAKSSSTVVDNKKDIRIYTLDCGYINIQDMASFSDKNFYPHEARLLADPCFLIKHQQDWLLWDIGWGTQYEGRTVEDKKHGVTVTVPISLESQLKKLGLKPNDIKYVAISHAHLDHSGDAGDARLFQNATFLLQKPEYDFTQQIPLNSAVAKGASNYLKTIHKKLLNGDYDLFGDGSVVILSTPGHTPGHQSLEVLLPHQGVIILSGDVYHTRQAYEYRLIPVFNTSRTETISSMNRIDDILQETHGRLIIQHELADYNSLPAIPNYLN